MAQLLEVTCRRCGYVSAQADGAVMHGFNPRCLECGESRFVSLDDLVRADDPDLDPAGDEVWEDRYRRIPLLAGTCECGGLFSEEAPIRCRSCHSTAVDTIVVGNVD